MKCVINNQLVGVKVLKTRKLFWIFEQVLVEYWNKTGIFDKGEIQLVKLSTKWILKSNLIGDYD